MSISSARHPGGRPRGKPTKVVRLPVPLANLARRMAERALAGNVAGFLDVETRLALSVPLVGSSVAAGFPSPADDYLDRPLDFNELLIRNPAATFAVRLAGLSMIGVGLFPNDIAIVDRSVQAVSGSIVLALIDGEFTIKRYRLRDGGVVLQAENPDFADIVVGEDATFEVWGVVTNAIRMF